MSDLADEILLEAEEKMTKAIASCQHELNQVRTGRANPAILDSIYVDYYGAPTQLRQLSSVTSPEANQLYIKPYDKSSLKDIMAAIEALSSPPRSVVPSVSIRSCPIYMLRFG
jgi:ribosome recycling factor